MLCLFYFNINYDNKKFENETLSPQKNVCGTKLSSIRMEIYNIKCKH